MKLRGEVKCPMASAPRVKFKVYEHGDIGMRLVRQFIQLAPLLCLFAACDGIAAESPYRMEGIVADADTQEPVEGTTVQVLITSEPDPSQKVRKAITDREGRYSIELPAGHAWAWMLQPPSGYCSIESNPTEVFATSDERPIFRKNYQVHKGTSVSFLVRHPGLRENLPNTYVSLGQQRNNEYVHGFCELDAGALGTVTLLAPVGRFTVSCGDESQTFVAPQGIVVDFEQGFDPQAVSTEVEERENGTVVVHDARGRIATLANCKAIVSSRKLTIVIEVESIDSSSESTQLQGRVVDTDGRGVDGATATVAFYSSGGGSSSSQITATTDSNGDYEIVVPPISVGQKVGLVVTGEGYGGVDTRPMSLSADSDGVVQVAPITLRAGCSIQVRVTGADGEPVHGAVVEPSNGYAARTRIARTEKSGECLLTDLAPGLMRVSVQFGSQSASTKIPLDSGENELVVLRLSSRLSPSSDADAPKELAVLRAGIKAPDWSISQWTDGKDRELADYEGKVVVLDFWGIWCSPCINAIPAMKELHDRYKDQDVVFLGIHTAGTELPLVKRLLKQQDWELAVGLDVGEDIDSGVTVQRYGIKGYPSVVILDRDGVVVFNSNDVPKGGKIFMQQIEKIAKSAGLPWPIDKDATEEEALERMTQLQVVMHSRVIDEALKLQAE